MEGQEGRNGSRGKMMRTELWVKLRNVGRARLRAGKMGRARGYGAHRQLTSPANLTDLGTHDVAPRALVLKQDMSVRCERIRHVF
jgi:hypothetical protein